MLDIAGEMLLSPRVKFIKAVDTQGSRYPQARKLTVTRSQDDLQESSSAKTQPSKTDKNKSNKILASIYEFNQASQSNKIGAQRSRMEGGR